MDERKTWPKDELVCIADMAMTERVARYQLIVRRVHELGRSLPPPMPNTLNATEIEAYLRRSDEGLMLLARARRTLSQFMDNTASPSSLD